MNRPDAEARAGAALEDAFAIVTAATFGFNDERRRRINELSSDEARYVVHYLAGWSAKMLEMIDLHMPEELEVWWPRVVAGVRARQPHAR